MDKIVTVNSARVVGITAYNVSVEVEVTGGIGIHLVGLPDSEVRESLLRVVTAIQALGYTFPGKKVVINIAPSHKGGDGRGYDLPIALGILAASGQVELPDLGDCIIAGELGLDGSVRPVLGGYIIAHLANRGGKTLILPAESAEEAAYSTTRAGVFGVHNLNDVISVIRKEDDSHDFFIEAQMPVSAWAWQNYKDMKVADFPFSEAVIRAATVAAAGGHDMAIVGVPGSGRTDLAKLLYYLLPETDWVDADMACRVFSASWAGKHIPEILKLNKGDFRSPHFSASLTALIGGGSGGGIAPGEVSLAHGGLLYIGDYSCLPKCSREALRVAHEDDKVVISRLGTKVEYPAEFVLVLGFLPCPCGYHGTDRCTCSPEVRKKYLDSLSSPLWDRIDVQVSLPEQVVHNNSSEMLPVLRDKVSFARIMQVRRYMHAPDISCNAEVTGKDIAKYIPISEACEIFLDDLMVKMNLPVRSYSHILRIARTIADMEMCDDILPVHLGEACAYRFMDWNV